MKYSYQLNALVTYLNTILCGHTYTDLSIRLIDDYDNKQIRIDFNKSTGLYHIVFIKSGQIRMDVYSETIGITLEARFIHIKWIDSDGLTIGEVHLYEPRIMEDMI